MTINSEIRLPAEWEEQRAVLLSWPHKETDWDYMLDEVEKCYVELITEIAKHAKVVLVAPNIEIPKERLAGHLDNIIFCKMFTNDTWARDFGPISVIKDGVLVAYDFMFNGWGLKFASCFDNRITHNLYSRAPFLLGKYENHLGFVLEGGAIDSDGHGALLTTEECMLSHNRNGELTKDEIKDKLKAFFGCNEVIWLTHGYLAGDDTDSHVDTLARFLPGGKIAYTSCDRLDDAHYEELADMELELVSTGRELVSLPIPEAIYDEDGQRLPATYANFFFLNGTLLLPIYGDEKYDQIAIERLKAALPDYEIVPINCLALIQQHGSLHCATMQLP